MGLCQTRGSREGRMGGQEAAPGGGGGLGLIPDPTWGHHKLRSTPAPPQHRCRFRFISGAPAVPLLNRYLSLNPSLLFPPRPLPPGSAPAAIPDPAHRPHP